LIFHGESDERVPFVNAQLLYRALADRGTEVTFWAYPREPHGFQEPAHVQHMMETWAAFFDEHLPRDGARSPARERQAGDSRSTPRDGL
jgi:dipeptidyl aminopeptidase/acylaminoacyl peptidase